MDYHFDANNQPLGRMASEIAQVLQGKKSPTYNPRLVGSDRAIVKNVNSLRVTGRKLNQKIYYRHTGYVGHLKEQTLKMALAKNPEWVLKEAVRRMLPKNFLNQKRLLNIVFIN
jgi:large subunit ribosomal protein L13